MDFLRHHLLWFGMCPSPVAHLQCDYSLSELRRVFYGVSGGEGPWPPNFSKESLGPFQAHPLYALQEVNPEPV
jgi:hypothetical protein